MDSVVNSSTLVGIGRNVGQYFSENVLGRFGPESLAFVNRNDRLICAGLGGVFGPEYAGSYLQAGRRQCDANFSNTSAHRWPNMKITETLLQATRSHFPCYESPRLHKNSGHPHFPKRCYSGSGLFNIHCARSLNCTASQSQHSNGYSSAL